MERKENRKCLQVRGNGKWVSQVDRKRRRLLLEMTERVAYSGIFLGPFRPLTKHRRMTFHTMGPLSLEVVETLYRQLSVGNFYSSDHVSVEGCLCHVTSTLTIILSSSEPSQCNDKDPRIAFVITRRVLLYSFCTISSTINQSLFFFIPALRY